MRGLNLRWRGMDRRTDVLSFPLFSSSREFPPEGDFPLGDIVIDPDLARRQAKEQGIPLGEELRRLIVHGLLHLLGYDHEKDADGARRMRRRERGLLKRLEAH